MRRTILKNLLAVTVLALTTAFANASPTAQEKSEPQESAAPTRLHLQKQAKVTMEAARATALKRAPGNVESSELERERGRLVYSFDIRNAGGTIDEVQVSAINGKVVRVEHENKKQEAAEKQKESREQNRKP